MLLMIDWLEHSPYWVLGQFPYSPCRLILTATRRGLSLSAAFVILSWLERYEAMHRISFPLVRSYLL